MALALEELNDCPQCDRRGETDWVDKRAGGDGRNRNAVPAIFCSELQAAAIRAREQFGFMFITTTPNWTDRMNNILCFQVAAGGDDRIANRATADAAAFLVNSRAAFRVNRAVRARALVQSPMRRRDYRICILVRDVAGHEPQFCISDYCLFSHASC